MGLDHFSRGDVNRSNRKATRAHISGSTAIGAWHANPCDWPVERPLDGSNSFPCVAIYHVERASPQPGKRLAGQGADHRCFWSGVPSRVGCEAAVFPRARLADDKKRFVCPTKPSRVVPVGTRNRPRSPKLLNTPSDVFILEESLPEPCLR